MAENRIDSTYSILSHATLSCSQLLTLLSTSLATLTSATLLSAFSTCLATLLSATPATLFLAPLATQPVGGKKKLLGEAQMAQFLSQDDNGLIEGRKVIILAIYGNPMSLRVMIICCSNPLS